MAYKATTTGDTLDRSGNPSRISMRLRRYSRRPAVAANESPSFAQVVWLFILHVPLMLIFYRAPAVGTIHSIVVLLLGFYFLLSDEQPTRVAWVIAYVTGAEILWRGSDSAVISEYGKYVTILLSILMILRYRMFGKNIAWPFLFVFVLIPGIFIAPTLDRQAISFQLAGPVALGIASAAFGGIELKRTDLQRLFLYIIAPTVSMGAFVAYTIVSSNVAFYGGGSNNEVSGGIGANQVSAALSLGALMAFFYIFLAGKDRRMRVLMILMTLGLLGLSVLTFSRGGLWTTVGAIGAALLFMARDRRRFFSILATVIVLGLLSYYVAVPLLEKITGGSIVTRFSSLDTTDRNVLFNIDLEVFKQNPIWGVGVGQSPLYHISTFGYAKPTHTEYGRLLAEHGLLGIVAMVILALVTLYRMLARAPALAKGITIGFTVWTLLYLVHSATRMVAPSLTFALASAHLLADEEVVNA